MHRQAVWFLLGLLIVASGVAGCGMSGAGSATPAASTGDPTSSVDQKKFWDERDRAGPGTH